MPDPVTMTTAVGYVRVSTPEQKREGVSPAAQTQAIRDYASLRGLELVEIIEDLGISAFKPLAQRPGGKRLLAKVASGEARSVVGLKLDRLFRNAEDCLRTVGEWDREDISLHLVNQGGSSIESRSATGRFLLTIMACVAEMERNMGAERTKEALDHKASLGERIGTVPYGYRVWIDGRRLEPDPDEQRVVEYMKTLREGGSSYSGIAKRLDAEGVRGRGARWHTSTVVRVLARPAHTKG